MPHTPWQILVADDEDEIRAQIKKTFDGEILDNSERIAEVIDTARLEHALELLSTHKIDVLILDLRGGSETPVDHDQLGNRVMHEIKRRRFVPVIFYTGIPHRVEEEETPQVLRIVKKDDGVEKLFQVTKEIFASGIPAANRAIMRHVEHVQRDFMWKSHELLTTYKDSIDKQSLAYLMARQLSASLQRTGIEDLAREMGCTDPQSGDAKAVHPMYFYRIPANPESINTGGVYRDHKRDDTHWVVLTTACDLDLKDRKIPGTNPVQYTRERKAERILLAECVALAKFKEYDDWLKKLQDKSIRSLIGNNREKSQADRWFFLPAGVECSDMVVDFQHLRTVSAEEIEEMSNLANIDSPFVESLISKFTRFYARVGTPDLDAELVLSRIKCSLGLDGASPSAQERAT